MADIIDFPPWAEANKQVDRIEARAEAWWNETKLPATLVKMGADEKIQKWIKRLAIQAWTEGATTAVFEYGDELRARGILPPRSPE